MHASPDTLFLRAARGETTERPPIWLMRQAGRVDPAYRALRDHESRPLEQLFTDPELAARITRLPKCWGVDALIIFQDILLPLAPMGAPFVFRPGPVPVEPVRAVDDLGRLRAIDAAEDMPHVRHVFRLVREAVGSTMPILGFAGAPLTLLCFLAEGGSPPESIPKTRALLREHPRESRLLLDLLTEMTADYLLHQVDCGADAVQLFESTADCFSDEEYKVWALPSQQVVLDRLCAAAPSILFARYASRRPALELLDASGADLLSLPATVSLAEARVLLGESRRLQGNLDNRLLRDGPPGSIRAATKACIAQGDCRGHIFNLSHGVLAETPFEHVELLMDIVLGYGGKGQQT